MWMYIFNGAAGENIRGRVEKAVAFSTSPHVVHFEKMHND